MPPLSVTALRQNLFKVVDQVLETGVPVEIERHGKKLLLVPEAPASKLANLKRREVVVGDPEDLVDLQVCEWREPDDL
jgi:prevent-host-death family protein